MAGTQKNITALDDDDDEERGEEKKERSKAKTRASQRDQDKSDRDLKGRLTALFDRISASLEEREDQELAEIIREDSEVMAQGLVSLTRPFKVLRAPVLLAVAIIEPILAFGRVLRVVFGRVVQNRAAQQQPEQPTEFAE